MKTILLATFALIISSNAWATGGFGCEIKEKGLKLEVSGVTSRGFGSALVETTAVLKGVIRDGKKKVPLAITFNKSHVSQYWNMGPELRLAYVIEHDGPVHSMTTVIIETKGKNKIDNEYLKGTATVLHYVANSAQITRYYDITCMVE